MQDAYAKALDVWPRDGVPDNPAAWLTTVAHRRALDLLRRESTLRRSLPLLVADDPPVPDTADLAVDGIDAIPDDRLRLICTCCHPALAANAQVALTLRLVCGVTTAEVARAFLTSESTMAARITRAKKKIALARIPYRVPSARRIARTSRCDLRRRAPVVHHGPHRTVRIQPRPQRPVRARPATRPHDACARPRRPHRRRTACPAAVDRLPPRHARRRGRPVADARRAGPQQVGPGHDRGGHRHWPAARCRTPTATPCRLRSPPCMPRHRPGGKPTGASSPACTNGSCGSGHLRWCGSTTRSPWDSRNGPAAGLALLDELLAEPSLATYGYFEASRAAFLVDLGRLDEARAAYEAALLLTENEVERQFLLGKLDGLG